MKTMRICPKCGSEAVAKLPPNGVTPFPGYRCEACELKMRANGTTALYLIVCVVSAALFVLFTMPFWNPEVDGGFSPVKIALSAGVAIYCARELYRPTPRRADPDRDPPDPYTDP